LTKRSQRRLLRRAVGCRRLAFQSGDDFYFSTPQILRYGQVQCPVSIGFQYRGDRAHNNNFIPSCGPRKAVCIAAGSQAAGGADHRRERPHLHQQGRDRALAGEEEPGRARMVARIQPFLLRCALRNKSAKLISIASQILSSVISVGVERPRSRWRTHELLTPAATASDSWERPRLTLSAWRNSTIFRAVSACDSGTHHKVFAGGRSAYSHK